MSRRHRSRSDAVAATEARQRELSEFVAAVEHAQFMGKCLEAVFYAVYPWPEAHAAATRALIVFRAAGS